MAGIAPHLLFVLSLPGVICLDFKFISPSICRGLTVPKNTAYRTLTVNWMLECVRHCSRDSNCSSATFDGSETCYMFSEDHLNCTEPVPSTGIFSLKFQNSEATTSVTCLNNGTLDTTTQTCTCYNGYIGDYCERIMQDCTEGFKSVHYKDDDKGRYLIKPTLAPVPFEVECGMKNEGGGTIILTNSVWLSGSLGQNLNWDQYKFELGKAEPGENHWLGLEYIHYLTCSRPQHLFFKVASDIDWKVVFRKYENFKVEDESTNYRMTYSGSYPWTQTEASSDPDWTDTLTNTPLGDSMVGLNGSAFSTFDRDNDQDAGRNCAADYKAGWWYNACADCNPLGEIKNPRTPSAVNEAFWKHNFLNNHTPYFQMLLRAA